MSTAVTICERIERNGVLPMVMIDEAADAAELGHALLAGGVDIVLILLRTPAAKGAIRLLRRDFPELLIGAGTVLSVEELEHVVSLGVDFAVSPVIDEEVLQAAERLQVTMIPGVATARDVVQGTKLGLSSFVFWPAEASGGVKTLEAFASPFPGVRFVALGGIQEAIVGSYLALPNVFAVGGKWLAPQNCIAEHRFSEIRNLVMRARLIAEAYRSN